MNDRLVLLKPLALLHKSAEEQRVSDLLFMNIKFNNNKILKRKIILASRPWSGNYTCNG